MSIPRFILVLSVVGLLLAGAAFLTVQYLAPAYSLLAVLLATAMAFFPTLLAYSITYMGLDKDTSRFVGFLLTGMLGKMLVGVLAIILVALRFREVRNEFVVAYLIGYFVFSAFEVYGLIRKLRPNF
ncbi:MAG: hypothetical protein D6722_11805 [Bacteroidetes bacterium]|nr:MAG: hypothetical protein D6722_11805 [Bacteroidota bacterium]